VVSIPRSTRPGSCPAVRTLNGDTLALSHPLTVAGLRTRFELLRKVTPPQGLSIADRKSDQSSVESKIIDWQTLAHMPTAHLVQQFS
jgi:hypothetical protein